MDNIYGQLYDIVKSRDKNEELIVSKDVYLKYLACDEFEVNLEEYHNLTPIDYVCVMYFLFLDRVIDKDAYEFWKSKCSKNGDKVKNEIVNAIMCSEEYMSIKKKRVVK